MQYAPLGTVRMQINYGTASVIKTHFLFSLHEYILLEQGNSNSIHTIHFTITQFSGLAYTVLSSNMFCFLFYYISNKMQRHTVYIIRKLLYMFRVVPLPIIRSANYCIYRIWYLSHRYCYLPLSWKSWKPVLVCCGWPTPPTAHSNRFPTLPR